MSDQVDRSVLPIRRPPFAVEGVALVTNDADGHVTSAVRKSVAQVDGRGAKQLKAALADAQAGLGG